MEVDKGNAPAELYAIKELDKGLSPKLTENKIRVLSRLVCIILPEFIDENEKNDHWELLLQLQTLTDIVFSPTLNNRMLDFFAEVYEENLLLFQQLFHIL